MTSAFILRGQRIAQVGISQICRNMSAAIAAEKPIEASIKRKLTETFQPKVLDIVNESYMHCVPKGSETHFKVLVVSDVFKDKPVLKRHQMVNEILKEELSGSIHALSVVAKTPEQWESSKQTDPSPRCLGGIAL